MALTKKQSEYMGGFMKLETRKIVKKKKKKKTRQRKADRDLYYPMNRINNRMFTNKLINR